MTLLTIIAPVFGIIALGYVAGKVGYLSTETARGIADFAFNVTIPALLFRTILLAKFDGVHPLGIMASFFGAAAIVWLLASLTTRFVLRRPAVDAPAIAMCCVFGNTIMLGLPIGVTTFGPDALAPISVVLSIHAPVFLLAATLHSAVVTEAGDSRSLGQALRKIGNQLIHQPLIIAITIATLWRISTLPLPTPLLAMVDMLAAAGVPAALISLGLSLRTFEIKGDTPTLGAMLVLKLAVMPLVAALLAFALGLPKLSAQIVVLMAALPAGANAYLFSMASGRATNSIPAAVAIGTALSSLTLAALIASALR